MLDIVCPFCKEITNSSPCENCGANLSAEFKKNMVNDKTIRRLVNTDIFLSTLATEEKQFIKLVMFKLNSSYKNRLIYESTNKYFGVKNIIDSTFVRFYFSKENENLFFKYRKNEFNVRDKILIEKYDSESIDKIVQCAVISMTYAYSFENSKKQKAASSKRKQGYIEGYIRRKNRTKSSKKRTSSYVKNELVRIIKYYEKVSGQKIFYDQEEFVNYLENNVIKTFDDFYKAPGISSNVSYIPEKVLSRVLFKY